MISGKKQPLSIHLLSKHVKRLMDLGERIDGRGFSSFREIKIKTNAVEKANGSAQVELGETIVVAGVKFELGEPFSDTPDAGILIVEGEILPLASLREEPGPPTEEEIELSRIVDRGIRESGMLDLKKLAINPGENVLKLFIDFNVVNDAGNIIDASSIAAVSALLTAKYPDVEKLKKMKKVTLEDTPLIPLPVNDAPIAVTFANLFGQLVVDPTTEEEAVMDSRLTITLTKEDRVCSVQKGGSGSLRIEQVIEALNMARKISKDIRRTILKQTGVQIA